MKKATYIDFDDSFTYNVVQLLTEIGFEVDVVSWREFESLPSDGLLVVGPGPGHPDDYESIFPLLRAWLKQERPYFGVCLGHQIFWRIRGEDIYRSKLPVHGQRIKLSLSTFWKNWLGLSQDPFVQRYNSLAVIDTPGVRHSGLQNFIQDEEVFITSGPHIITYQFHPESIGTSFRKAFMRPVNRDLV